MTVATGFDFESLADDKPIEIGTGGSLSDIWKLHAGELLVDPMHVDFDVCPAGWVTAWSPPLPVIQKASELCPELEFNLDCEYEVNGFAEQYAYKGGGRL